MHKIHLSHLGCAKNMVDSEIFLSHFHEMGFEETQEPNDADLILVNTCGFIASAKEQSIDTIFESLEQKNAKVVVAGCLYQRYSNLPDQMPEVHGWLNENSFSGVKSLVEKLGFEKKTPSSSIDQYGRILLEKSSHAYLRISEGCDKSCSFCSIPGFKGKMVSRSIDSLLEEAQKLLDQGIQEINVVSQDTCNYGADIYGPAKGGKHLRTLIEKLCELDVFRIRLLYLYPLWLDQEFYQMIADQDKVCKYIDMPLQHASKDVLRKMKRPGDGERYLKELALIRNIIPGVTVRSTFVSGFPGETEQDHEQLKQFIEDAHLDWMGVFPYFREEGTSSFNMKSHVHHATRKKRAKELTSLWENQFFQKPSRVNEVHTVLIEEVNADYCIARTSFQAPEVDGVVYLPKYNGSVGEVLDVKVTADLDFDLEASPA